MKLFLFAGVVVLGMAGFSGWFWFQHQLSPVSSQVKTQIFVIKKGQGIDSIGAALQTAGLIRSPIAFKYTVTVNQLAKKIQAGTFKVSPSMSTREIAQNLTHGITEGIEVQLLEGWRREEFAAAIEEAFLVNNSTFDPNKFLALTKGKEGFLFPDTYQFPVNASESSIIQKLTSTFDQRVAQRLQNEIKQSNKSLAEIITLASLVEREARSDTARQMVSGILWNRLDAGWPLQVDATLQYAVGFDAKNQTWWDPPTSLDKNIKSPYNTYLNPGLPPGPICAPSLSSIEAALNPTPSDYWFYLTGNDNQMHYATTAAEHSQNIAKYLK